MELVNLLYILNKPHDSNKYISLYFSNFIICPFRNSNDAGIDISTCERFSESFNRLSPPFQIIKSQLWEPSSSASLNEVTSLPTALDNLKCSENILPETLEENTTDNETFQSKFDITNKYKWPKSLVAEDACSLVSQDEDYYEDDILDYTLDYPIDDVETTELEMNKETL